MSSRKPGSVMPGDSRLADSPRSSMEFRQQEALSKLSEPPSSGDGNDSVRVDPRHPRGELATRTVARGHIGAGGMAAIKRVMDTNLLRESAMKVLHEAKRKDTDSLGRFIEEAQITAQLAHPNIVPVYELGVNAEGALFFTMKVVEGRTLYEILMDQNYQQRTMNDLFAHLQVLLKVCDAVGYAHSRGVIHRDLKPDNIMVGRYGQVYVMDWGIAKLLDNERPSEMDREIPDRPVDPSPVDTPRYDERDEEGMILGTPGFMAPEQALGELDDVDERSDIFSLGAILYMILTQAAPYFGRTSQEMVVNTLVTEIKPPDEIVSLELPPRLCEIAMRALKRKRSDRFQSIDDLKEAIEDFLRSGWQLQSRSYKAGAVIVSEGQPGDEAFVIIRGQCEALKEVRGEQIRLGTLGPGDAFGEMALLTDKPRTATVAAVDEVKLYVVTKEELDAEMGMGVFIGRFLSSLARRFNERDGRTTMLEEALDDTELTIKILKYMSFAGDRVDSGRVEIKWSTMCEMFADNFGKTSEEVAVAVGNSDIFELDSTEDILALERSG